jgi:flavin-dependent dehydrogenase
MAGKIHVLGAGLSGMVAAINLAREGFEVLVLEGAKGIGGMGGLHPSVHTTPIDPAWMSTEIGIDVTPAFHRPKGFLLGLGDKTFKLNPGPMHTVERGPRPTSIDTLLYEEARKSGVSFQFGVYLKDLREIPKGSIVATGLHTEMFDFLAIPYETPRGFASTRKTDWDTWCASTLASYTDDYFYANCVNHLMYGLLFGRKKITVENLEACKKDIREKFGLDLEHWEYFTVRVPTASARNPRLFQDGYILAGTLSGAMDPVALFGIHGALLSGKVAAVAAQDPERGWKAFRRISRFFPVAFYLKQFQKKLPASPALMEFSLRHPRLFYPLMIVPSFSVPGWRGGVWNYEVFRGAERVGVCPRIPFWMSYK